MKELITAIKSKKGLERLDDDFVKDLILRQFAANKILERKFKASKSFSQFSRSKEYEQLLKTIRKDLRRVYGVFQIEDRDAALRSDDAAKALLATHTSTKERLPYYDSIYAAICELKPKKILDLGCGMNPLAYHYFTGCKPYIIASDISTEDMKFLSDAFERLNIPGETVKLDLTKEYSKLSNYDADVVLMFKLLDSLEEASRHISYKIFDNIKADWIVASFPTKSLGGRKNIARAGRTWFERLLARKGLQWKTFSVPNELFYVIKNT